jgi:hypothetical protein
MKQVNMTIGRFQPFTKGHLQMCKDGYDKNKLPCVIMMIENKKYDEKHPFTDETIKREIDILKLKNKFIEDVILVKSADIVKAGQALFEAGYEPQLWLCGDDRVAQYDRMISKEQYRIDGHLPEKFATYTGKGRTEGVSGTAAREALKNNDLQAFKRIMPDGADKLYNEMRDELLKVVKEHNETHSLSEYLKENLKRF